MIRLHWVATVPTACGIETIKRLELDDFCSVVATVPTACGIETLQRNLRHHRIHVCCNSTYRLRY